MAARGVPRGANDRYAQYSRHGLSLAIGAALVWIATFLVRFLYPEFANDHFVHLSRARQILTGEVPSRDFVDPGLVLHYYASAAALWVSGYNLFGEALLTISALATASAIVFVLASTFSRSMWIGAWLALATIAVYPRLYNYPKVLLYPLALLVASWYDRAPSRLRLWLLGLVVAVAVLFRYDHGLYIAVGTTIVLVVRHWSEGIRRVIARLVECGAVTGLVLSPYLAFLAMHGDLLRQAGTAASIAPSDVALRLPPFAVDMSAPLVSVAPRPLPLIHLRWREGMTDEQRVEAERQLRVVPLPPQDGVPVRYGCLDCSRESLRAIVDDPRVADTHWIDRSTGELVESRGVWFRRQHRTWNPFWRVSLMPGVLSPANAQPLLARIIAVTPYVALVLLAYARVRGGGTAGAAVVTSAAVVCLIINVTLVRGSYDSRLPDVTPPNMILLGWIIGEWLTARSGRAMTALRRAAAVGVILVTVWATWQYGGFTGRLASTQLFNGPRAMTTQFGEWWRRLHGAPVESGVLHDDGILTLGRYLARCTEPSDRLLVTGMAPELYVFADRSFAGGHVFLRAGWHRGLEEQRVTVQRLQRQSVPIIIFHAREYAAFQEYYPLVHAYIAEHYDVAAESTFGGRAPLRVMAARHRIPKGRDAMTELPCFR